MIDLLEGAQCLSPSTAREDSPIPTSPSRSPRTRLSARTITKLAECRHFHYATVELGPIDLRIEEETENGYVIGVASEGETWQISRSWTSLIEFDQQLHRCIFERRHSKLAELGLLESDETAVDSGGSTSTTSKMGESRRRILDSYLNRLSRLTGSLITCYPVLKFLEVDSRGRHFLPPEMSAINTPAIAAAIVTKEFIAEQPDQLTIRVGDIISIIEMCSRMQNETIWWKAKLTISSGKGVQPAHDENSNTFKIGFFPSNCVQLFEDKGINVSPPAHHKSFSAARRVSQLFKRGRRRNPVFGCDLQTHLERSGRRVPLILERCVDVIEKHGIVTGIYRQCGIQSNIQRLRAKFDCGADPDLFEFTIVRDVYCVSSLLKQYFRQLPNPIFTYQAYHSLLDAFESETEAEKIRKLKIAMDELPLGHFNTARYLMKHLNRLCDHTNSTDMTSRNLAIVWAPNLFRAPPSINGQDSHLLSGLNVHTSLCNFIIEHTNEIFGDEKMEESFQSVSGYTDNYSSVLHSRHQSFNGLLSDDEDPLKKSQSDSRFSRLFRGKSVDEFVGGFRNRRRTLNGQENSRMKEGISAKPEPEEEKVKWRRSQSTDAFRAGRSDSIISMITKGYGEIRDGVRTWTKRAYSLRPGSRPPPSPQLTHLERMNDSVTVSTMSRVSTADSISRPNGIREESPTSSCSGSLKEFMTTKEKRVAFRTTAFERYADLPLAERSSPVEEWSSESRNSPLLEMSRYDNVSPARPREHVIDRVVAGFEPTIESPSPSPSPQYNNGTPC
ncbi:rrc-1 [Pristionchus pacificus]|uniref:Rrc-1 n=1 Tax=Pristionchus pacificus TaxID=54126 RepID=A0A2A6CUE6_PRIPA|nr:rrc-1 [Pristionchus pacificus]|eukprot:PDM81706.1 rrc-1 [Pristionchus pacificus]